VLLAAALAVVSGSAAAQATALQNEISVFGTWDDVSEPQDIETSTINLRYGRVVRPQLLATATVGYSRFEGGGAESSTLSVLGGAKYYFNPLRTQGLIPFVDAGIGFATTDTNRGDSTDLTWEFGGGVAYFINAATSLDASLRLYWTDTEARTEGTRFFVGLTTRF
jgi:hypothetical protein